MQGSVRARVAPWLMYICQFGPLMREIGSKGVGTVT